MPTVNWTYRLKRPEDAEQIEQIIYTAHKYRNRS